MNSAKNDKDPEVREYFGKVDKILSSICGIKTSDISNIILGYMTFPKIRKNLKVCPCTSMIHWGTEMSGKYFDKFGLLILISDGNIGSMISICKIQNGMLHHVINYHIGNNTIYEHKVGQSLFEYEDNIYLFNMNCNRINNFNPDVHLINLTKCFEDFVNEKIRKTDEVRNDGNEDNYTDDVNNDDDNKDSDVHIKDCMYRNHLNRIHPSKYLPSRFPHIHGMDNDLIQKNTIITNIDSNIWRDSFVSYKKDHFTVHIPSYKDNNKKKTNVSSGVVNLADFVKTGKIKTPRNFSYTPELIHGINDGCAIIISKNTTNPNSYYNHVKIYDMTTNKYNATMRYKYYHEYGQLLKYAEEKKDLKDSKDRNNSKDLKDSKDRNNSENRNDEEYYAYCKPVVTKTAIYQKYQNDKSAISILSLGKFKAKKPSTKNAFILEMNTELVQRFAPNYERWDHSRTIIIEGEGCDILIRSDLAKRILDVYMIY